MRTKVTPSRGYTHASVVWEGGRFARPVPYRPDELVSRSNLLSFLDLSESELKKIWWYRHRMYLSFKIPKRSGGNRAILAPDARLKFLQRKILTLLEKLYVPRHAVHGFVKGRGAVSNAQQHVHRPYLVNIDLSVPSRMIT